jgi:hypothetical protein
MGTEGYFTVDKTDGHPAQSNNEVYNAWDFASMSIYSF